VRWQDFFPIRCRLCGLDLMEKGPLEDQVTAIVTAELEKEGLLGAPLTEFSIPQAAAILERIQPFVVPVVGLGWCAKCSWERSAEGVISAGAMPLPEQREWEDAPAGATCPFWLSMHRLDQVRVTWDTEDPWLCDPKTLVDWRVGNDQIVSQPPA
jgi:hypothetical protein